MNIVKNLLVKVNIWLILFCSTVLVLAFQGGCASKGNVIAQLQDVDPVVRVRAIIRAGDEGLKQAVPLLVDRLAEEDEAVRFFAISALRKIVGTDYGYDYKSSEAERAEAIVRWRKAIATQGLQGDKTR